MHPFVHALKTIWDPGVRATDKKDKDLHFHRLRIIGGGVSPQTTHRVTKSGTPLQRLGTQSINKGRKIQEDSRHEECCDGRELGWRDRESPGATEVWVAEEGLI